MAKKSQSDKKTESWLKRLRKKVSERFKRSYFYQKLRASRLNPYHTFLEDIKAESVIAAKEEAIARNLPYFRYDGVRISTDENYSIPKEGKIRTRIMRTGKNALDEIPRDKNNHPDLMAEDPILIAVLPMNDTFKIGHVAMQYKGYVVNRLLYKMDMKPLVERYGDLPRYYFIYPSKVGINTKKLVCAMHKANIIKGGKYNFFVKNCANSVDYVLRQAGVKDLDEYGPDKTGIFFATPGNNPFHKGIEAWCRKHGIQVYAHELVEVYTQNQENDPQKMQEDYMQSRERYLQYKKYLRYGSIFGRKNSR